MECLNEIEAIFIPKVPKAETPSGQRVLLDLLQNPGSRKGFNWMIPNHYMKNGCFTKHPINNGCLEYQVHKFQLWDFKLKMELHFQSLVMASGKNKTPWKIPPFTLVTFHQNSVNFPMAMPFSTAVYLILEESAIELSLDFFLLGCPRKLVNG